MKRTNATGQTCIGDLRLAPIDVGFDLRAAGHTVMIPERPFASVGLEQDGETWLIEGEREELIQAIKDAGYEVRLPRYDDPRDLVDWDEDLD